MKKLLFTGASGFLGDNMKPLLIQMYEVQTLGLTDKDNLKVNLVDKVPKFTEKFEVVLHAAGKAHSIPRTEEEKQAFFDVNYKGTKNLCRALENSCLPRCFIFISTVAVYGLDFGVNIDENYPLKGTTPYALSKIQAEDYLIKWCKAHKIKLSILRPSLLAGANPLGNLGAMINGIQNHKYFRIGDGSTRKSILMAKDIALLVPKLCSKGGIYNLCDNHHPSFAELEKIISLQLNTSIPFSIPLWLAKFLAIIGDLIGNKFPINSDKLNKLIKPLTFSNEKAKKELAWKPLNVFENFKIQ